MLNNYVIFIILHFRCFVFFVFAICVCYYYIVNYVDKKTPLCFFFRYELANRVVVYQMNNQIN